MGGLDLRHSSMYATPSHEWFHVLVNISEHPCMKQTSVLAFGNDTTTKTVFPFGKPISLFVMSAPSYPIGTFFKNCATEMNIMLDIMLPRSKHGACWTG